MLNTVYVISQIITIIYHVLLCTSYLVKDRSKILLANFAAHIGQAVAMFMLDGYSGAAMALIMAVYDLYLFVEDKKKDVWKEPEVPSFLALAVILAAIVIMSIRSYEGPLSMLSVVATLVGVGSRFQSNTKVYKFLGIIGGTLWLAYNFYIVSLMGIILEAFILGASIIGFLREVRKK